MARAFVWIVMAAVILGGGYKLVELATADPGMMLGTAMSEPDNNNKVLLQVVVPMLLWTADPAPLTPEGEPDYQAWLDSHYILRDSAGTLIPFRKGHYKSKNISEGEAGTAEFIALADLDAGQDYEMELIPLTGRKQKYLRKFKAEALAYSKPTYATNY